MCVIVVTMNGMNNTKFVVILYIELAQLLTYLQHSAQKQLVIETARSDQLQSNGEQCDVTWRDVTSHGAARCVMLNSPLLLRHNNFF